jgi:formylmethanofuran dehydrogenase subunit E
MKAIPMANDLKNVKGNFRKSRIVTCSICDELIPQVLTAIKNKLVYCNACCRKAYYNLIEDL